MHIIIIMLDVPLAIALYYNHYDKQGRKISALSSIP